MKPDKKVFFRIHSWIGIRLSILFFIVCFSGTLATLSHEMDWLFIPEMRVSPGKLPAGRNFIVKNLKQKFPDGQIQYWMSAEEPYLCDIIYVMQGTQRSYVFANPYTGAIQGSATLTFQRFFRDLHYYLFIPFQVGHFIVLVFAFMLLASLITGLFFYKKWYRKLFELRTGKGSLVFFRSLHRLAGVWSVPFVILISATGIWYFVERANIAGVGEWVNPGLPEVAGTETLGNLSEGHLSYLIDYDRAALLAREVIDGLEVKDIYPADAANKALYLTGKDDTPLVRNRANRVYFNPVTYEVLKVQKARELDLTTWINDIADPIHFGYWGGLVTKVIWFIFGLGVSSLVLTGIWISQKRQVKSQAKMKARKMGIWKYVNWGLYIVMLGFMYTAILGRYQASVLAVSAVTAGWCVFTFGAWYLFDYRLNRTVRRNR